MNYRSYEITKRENFFAFASNIDPSAMAGSESICYDLLSRV
jgi:hypothetical protein